MMAIDVENFSELMTRVRQGESEALQCILNEYGEAIQREVRFTLLDTRLRRFVGDSDVYQSVVFRFCSGMQSGSFTINEPADLVRLMKGIARTRIAELVRFWHAQRRDLSRTTNIECESGIDHRRSYIPVDELLSRAEMAAAIQNRLSARDVNILQLRDDGLSWQEIAHRLNGISGEAVRKQHSRSLGRIAAEFDGSD